MLVVIKKKIEATTGERRGNYRDWKEFEEDLDKIYQDTKHITIIGWRGETCVWPEKFPLNLTGLAATQCDFRAFPPSLALGLTYIRLTDCRLQTVPESLKLLEHLEELDLTMNDISEFRTKLPAGIVSLRLGYNRIHTFSTNIPETLKYVDLSFNKLTKIPENLDDLERVKIDHNEFDKYFSNAYDHKRIKNKEKKESEKLSTEEKKMLKIYTKTTKEDKQTTHEHNIQDSTHDSCKKIMEYKKKLKIYDQQYIEAFIAGVQKYYKDRNEENNKNSGVIKRIFSKIANIYVTNTVEVNLRDFYERNPVHGRYGVSFNELLFRVFLIISDMPQEKFNSAFGILVEELSEGFKTCETGVFSRIINSLSGIYDGVEIKMSQEQDLANKAGRILENNTEKYGEDTDEFKENYKQEMEELFKEYDLSDYQLNVWNEVVNDLVE